MKQVLCSHCNKDTSNFYIKKNGGSTLVPSGNVLLGTNGTNTWVGTIDTELSIQGSAARPEYVSPLSGISEIAFKYDVDQEALKREGEDYKLSNRINNDATPHTTGSLSLAVASWSNKQQTVIISGYDNTKLNTVIPDLASAVQWANCGINAVSENSNGITFSCSVVPTSTLTFKVVSEKIIS